MTSSAPTLPAKVSNITDESSWADFTQLTGIGPATQKQLHETLDIHTFTDLASWDPTELIAGFRQVERTISITQAESWIAQAVHRLDHASHALLDSHEEYCKGPLGQASRDEDEVKDSASSRMPPFWPMPPIITHVSFHQPWRFPSDSALGIATPTQPMRQPLKPMEPFALNLHCQYSASNGPTPNDLASTRLNEIELLHYSVEVYAHHRQSSSVKCLGHLPQEAIRVPRDANSLGITFSTVVKNAYLAKTGIYRFKILVKWAEPYTNLGYLEIPMIQVT